ncbi:hypothetical protein Taro_053835 [Colocasia esculenta]|uniref:Uncharacterized protein n=1 Tax=Colocasia esculenta TaxID=4460 RepID=A0A843XPD9_COLES|nr:hypothetical protein [Colocasia esculenta]
MAFMSTTKALLQQPCHLLTSSRQQQQAPTATLSIKPCRCRPISRIAVGFFVGAITGALIGLAIESGLFRGAGIRAISGAIFSIDVVESSLRIWSSRGSGIWSILYVIEIIASLLSGRLVREKVGHPRRAPAGNRTGAPEATQLPDRVALLYFAKTPPPSAYSLYLAEILVACCHLGL